MMPSHTAKALAELSPRELPPTELPILSCFRPPSELRLLFKSHAAASASFASAAAFNTTPCHRFYFTAISIAFRCQQQLSLSSFFLSFSRHYRFSIFYFRRSMYFASILSEFSLTSLSDASFFATFPSATLSIPFRTFRVTSRRYGQAYGGHFRWVIFPTGIGHLYSLK